MSLALSRRVLRPLPRTLALQSGCLHTPPSAPNTSYSAITHPENPESVPEVISETIKRSASVLLPVYARPPFILERGRGAYLWDTQGRKYLDFSGGIAVNALGHADPELADRMAEQAKTLLHTSNVYYNAWAGKLAELLVTLTQHEGGLGWQSGSTPSSPPQGAKVFFSNSGTEANEGALKIARKVGKARGGASKFRFACFANGFHGRSMGALSATATEKYQAPFEPLVPGFDVGKLNDLEGLERLVTKDTCGVIVEPIQGEGGIHVAGEEWLRALRLRCDQVGAVLIFDEIQCGLFRSGTMWAHSALPTECHPDVITMAKPLANGYPIGAVLMRDSVAECMTVGTHGTTFGGSPLACALGHHVLSRVSDRAFVASVKKHSSYLHDRLSQLPLWFPTLVEDIRGRGFIQGIAFRDVKHPGKIVSMARERGVLLLTAGKDAVRIVPSLNVGVEEIDGAVDVIESCLGLVEKEVSD
ncbi:acetylornithine and succinylornithine aminotransferase [Rickenella mellea]|uniref:acetylornithine transaminase n=1 Tax=Rickenella mellea TaxID=50990 RepID=A0A4R5XE74_9AGAM|nr:acetylornithine and succinylornithine aminotransferase [Rickenella mellea]